MGDQLASISAQSRLPDEVVVGDDGSTDGSLDLVRAWGREAGMQVEVLAPTPAGRPLGSVANYERTLRACRGDFVALADQDDVWHPDKLAVLERLLERGASLACTDAELVDAHLRPLGRTAWQGIQLENATAALSFASLLRRNVVTGATVAISRALLEIALPFPDVIGLPGLPYHHDGWLAVLAAATGDVAADPRPLIQYRQHAAQQIGLAPRRSAAAASDRRRLAQGAVLWLLAIKERLAAVPGGLPSGLAANLDNAIKHFHGRASLPPSHVRRLGMVARELTSGRYAHHGGGLPAAALDLLAR